MQKESATNKSKQAAIKAMVEAAKASGLPGVVIGFEVDGLVSTHFENMHMQGVAQVAIALFNQMCDFEAGVEGRSQEQKQAMVDLKNNFLQLIKTHNARFARIRDAAASGGGTKTA